MKASGFGFLENMMEQTNDGSKTVIGTFVGPSSGSGKLLHDVLSAQRGVASSVENRPLLPWEPEDATVIQRRFQRFREERDEKIMADVAAFYLPYLPAAFEAATTLRVVHLTVSQDETVERFERLLDARFSVPIHHWLDPLSLPWCHDFDWSRTYPKYDIYDRADAIRRYWEDYEEAVDALTEAFGDRVLRIERDELLTESGIRRVLDFCEIPKDERQIKLPKLRSPTAVKRHPRSGVVPANINDPRRCIILVPTLTHIEQKTEKSLRILERRGYIVRRIFGISAIDVARSRMVTEALCEGFAETFWIDSDMGFDPQAVEQVRAHGQPIMSGIYSKKGHRSFSSALIRGNRKISLGKNGGVCEVLYAAAGFLHVRREVYESIERQLDLPTCNEAFRGKPFIPFFQPIVVPRDESWWYLGEDYAFCHRARECGFEILVDTSIRLWHYGKYGYGWEDIAAPRRPMSSVTIEFRNRKPVSATNIEGLALPESEAEAGRH